MLRADELISNQVKIRVKYSNSQNQNPEAVASRDGSVVKDGSPLMRLPDFRAATVGNQSGLKNYLLRLNDRSVGNPPETYHSSGEME